MTSILLKHYGRDAPFLIPYYVNHLQLVQKRIGSIGHRYLLALTDFCLNEDDYLEREEIICSSIGLAGGGLAGSLSSSAGGSAAINYSEFSTLIMKIS